MPSLLLCRVALSLGLLLGAWSLARADIPYTPAIRIEGPENPELLDTLKKLSQLMAFKDRPPASEGALRRRADDDADRLKSVMQAEGFWAASVSDIVDTTTSPAKVTLVVTPGPLFHLNQIQLRSGQGEPLPALEGSFGLAVGAAARSAPVEAANDAIIAHLGNEGYPFAKILDRKAVVDLATEGMALTFTIDPGPKAKFGATTITGLDRLERDFVERRINWETGASYDGRLVEATRRELAQSGLFSMVRVTHAATLDLEGRVAMAIELTEGPPRSIGAGIAYNTTLGFGTRAFWQHRNLFGEGEQLQLSALLAQRELGIATSFRRPDLGFKGQDLVASGELLRQETDAYHSRRFGVYSGVEEREIPLFTFGAGLGAESAIITRSEHDEDYALLSFPFFARRDSTDNALDPTTGTRTTLTFIPYKSFAGPDLSFVTARIEGQAYQAIGPGDRVILAGYGAVGSLLGPGLDAIPVDKRLYAGGAGSVRAYAFQRAGPLDALGRPTGGRSSVEFGGELRYRITSSIGIVPFLEAGNVYDASFPDRGTLFYGGGVGLRYYTPIGPLRLDLATPFLRRASDSVIQVYVSIGQAF
ncbi:MAG TPA: BamA/TamA family outer membrane protein [Stellaceae bacterium]|nr:BamA/TamA family outer membrane protein [Stellaceae bacterium]